MPKQTKPINVAKPTEQQLADLQSDDVLVRASCLIDMFEQNLPALPAQHKYRMKDRKTVELMLHSTFDNIGGARRMAQWAHENPSDFYKLYAKLLPPEVTSAQATQIIINSPVPRNALDDVGLTVEVEHKDVGGSDIDF